MFLYKTKRGKTIYVDPKHVIHQKIDEYTVYALEKKSQLEDYRNWVAKAYFFKDSKKQSKIEESLLKSGIEPQYLLFFNERCIGYLMRTDKRKFYYTENNDLVVVEADVDTSNGNSGGEVEVFSLCSDTELPRPDRLVAKIYHKPLSKEQIKKLTLQTKKRKKHKRSIQRELIPIHFLYKDYGKNKSCVGCLMERLLEDNIFYKTQKGKIIYVDTKHYIHLKFDEYTVYALEKKSQLDDYENWVAKVYFFKDSKKQMMIEKSVKERGIDSQNLLFFNERCIGYLIRVDNKILCYTEQRDLVIADRDSCLGHGGEGEVYSLCSDTELSRPGTFAAKIYHNPPSEQQVEKLELLLRKQKEGKFHISGVCFPLHILYRGKGEDKRCVGYLMKRFDGRKLFDTVFQPVELRENLQWTRVDICVFAETLLRRFMDLHEAGILVGDINPHNILVSSDPNKLVIIDADSFQIEDYPCPVHLPGFVPPRLLNVTDFSTVMRTPEDEYYSITVLLFEIVLIGKHPYARSDKGTLEEHIRDRNFVFPLGYGDNTLMPKGPWQLIWYNLPRTMREGFFRTFHDGEYVLPTQWLQIFMDYRRDMQQNLYPSVIFPTSNATVLSSEDCVSGLPLNDVDVVEGSDLNQIENVLSSESSPVLLEEIPIIHFGRHAIMCYVHQKSYKKSRTLATRIDSPNLDYVDRCGCFNISGFLELSSSEALFNWLRIYVQNPRPQPRILYALGGSFMRSLINREEVVRLLQQHFGIHFGILSNEQEVRMLIDAIHYIMPELYSKPIVFINQSNTSLQIVFKNSKGEITDKYLNDMGLSQLQNRVFRLAQRQSATRTILTNHDHSIADQLQRIIIGQELEGATVFASGVLKELLPKTNIKQSINVEKPKLKNIKKSKESLITNVSLKQLEDSLANLNEQLSKNRIFIQELYDDMKKYPFLEERVNLRLGLPIYSQLMNQTGADSISLAGFGIGESFIIHKFSKL